MHYHESHSLCLASAWNVTCAAVPLLFTLSTDPLCEKTLVRALELFHVLASSIPPCLVLGEWIMT